MRRWLPAAVLCFLAWGSAGAAVSAPEPSARTEAAAAPSQPVTDEQSPEGVVRQFEDALLQVMHNAKQLGYRGRYERLDPVVRRTHDLAEIARIASGRYWMKLDERSRQELVDAFSRLSIATYAFRFDDYSGQSFTVTSEEPMSGAGVVVHSVLKQPGEQDTHFDYMMAHTDQGWRIVNIIVDGVSDLAMKRAEYASILSKSGVQGLIAKLESKIAEYSGAQS